MRIIKYKTLEECWKKHSEVEDALKAWYQEMKHCEFNTPDDIKKRFGSADILRDNRVVFNIKGNHFRLIVKFHYNRQMGYIRFVGTHKEYDKINAEEI